MFSYRLTWLDSQKRPWASELMTFEAVGDARKAHASSCRGHWVKAGMLEPQVTPLYWESDGRNVAVQWPDGNGGVTTEMKQTEPPADLVGLTKNEAWDE